MIEIMMTRAPSQPIRDMASCIRSTDKMQPEAGSREKMIPTLLEDTSFSQWI